MTMLSILSACLLGFVGLLLRWSPGKPKPFVDKYGRPLAGSISEKTFVDINGVRQGMFIKGKDATNPVLLYLHGGMPDYFLTRRYPRASKTISPCVGGNSAVRGSPTLPAFRLRPGRWSNSSPTRWR